MIGEVAGLGAGFKGAISYLLTGGKDNPKPDRVAWVELRNLASDNPRHAPALMRATAAQSARCKKPLYHLVLSWREDENPSDTLMREHVDETLRDLALEHHQSFIAAHTDTAHRHVHIVVNRVHPETTKAWSRSNDYRRIEVSLRRQAEGRGLPYVPGKFNDPARFGKSSARIRNGEYRAAARNGTAVPKGKWNAERVRELRGALGPVFEAASCWDQLADGLRAHHVVLAAKGQGLIIAGSDGFMKLSDLGKQIRFHVLEQRYAETFHAYAGRAADGNADAVALRSAPAQDAPKAVGSRGEIDEDGKQRLRLEWRQGRRPGKPSASKPGDTSTEDAAEAGLARDPGVSVVPVSANDAPARTLRDNQKIIDASASDASFLTEDAAASRRCAFNALAEVRAAFDLARALHGAGLLGDKGLAVAARDVRRAEDDLAPHLSFDEQIRRDIREALAEETRARKPATASDPPKHRGVKSRDRDR